MNCFCCEQLFKALFALKGLTLRYTSTCLFDVANVSCQMSPPLIVYLLPSLIFSYGDLVTCYNWSSLIKYWHDTCPSLIYRHEVSTCCSYYTDEMYVASKRHWPNVGLRLGQRRRRWTNIRPTLGQCLLFAGRMWDHKWRHSHKLQWGMK